MICAHGHGHRNIHEPRQASKLVFRHFAHARFTSGEASQRISMIATRISVEVIG
jgi:hypothetical protein